MNNSCPCESGKKYEQCCGPYIEGTKKAPTAEALMRSRYSAYTKHRVDYIDKTNDPNSGEPFDFNTADAWAKNSEWLGLEVVSVEAGSESDTEGAVEFIAKFKTEGNEYAHHELALFRKDPDGWVYVDGKVVQKPHVRSEEKVGRNDPCTCGSGKKFKKCCGAAA